MTTRETMTVARVVFAQSAGDIVRWEASVGGCELACYLTVAFERQWQAILWRGPDLVLFGQGATAEEAVEGVLAEARRVRDDLARVVGTDIHDWEPG